MTAEFSSFCCCWKKMQRVSPKSSDQSPRWARDMFFCLLSHYNVNSVPRSSALPHWTCNAWRRISDWACPFSILCKSLPKKAEGESQRRGRGREQKWDQAKNGLRKGGEGRGEKDWPPMFRGTHCCGIISSPYFSHIKTTLYLAWLLSPVCTFCLFFQHILSPLCSGSMTLTVLHNFSIKFVL